ncbi:GNAT family N-acetyltransferase [Metabacillus litoralis]|uniref:GNAT family N-acetyltransferase n=1 Tax=Metabacillus litoralis TaxID=152268 RepID=UPI001CFF500D|nr:GNAT family N-acetyltransferase [Metabacillus litoralis]
MNIITIGSWSDEIWHDISPIYFEEFGDKGAKPVKVIKNMLNQRIAELHVWYNNTEAVGMALTGILSSNRVMIIDYLAISVDKRGQGLGKQFVHYLREKASAEGYQKLIVETEAEETEENKRRIHFWNSYGFLLTKYVHQYIWVPETYHAMYIPLIAHSKEITGEELFIYLNTFHRLSFRESKK